MSRQGCTLTVNYLQPLCPGFIFWSLGIFPFWFYAPAPSTRIINVSCYSGEHLDSTLSFIAIVMSNCSSKADYHCRLCLCKFLCQGFNIQGRYPAYLFCPVRCIFGEVRFQRRYLFIYRGINILCSPDEFKEILVIKIVLHYHITHGKGNCTVSSRLDWHPFS